MAKVYSQTYLYSQYSEYEKKIFNFLVNAERIDTTSSEFADIIFDIKRRKISDHLTKVLTSKKVVVGIYPGNSLPKAFKSFVAADPKDGKTVKLFIDATDCITFKDGVYVCNQKLDWLISYLISGTTSYIYANIENKLLGNASLTKDGCDAWVKCFNYIIDRMYKTSTVPSVNAKIQYLAAIYYQVCIIGKDINHYEDSIKANAIRTSNIDPKEAKAVDVFIEDGDFDNIDTFTSALGRIMNLKDIKTANIVSYWMNAFGPGTVFALEYFPAFACMMTNTYVGGYLDQQMTIEKICGRSLISFTKTILQIGASV